MYFIGSMLAVLLIPLILIFTFGLPILAAVLVYKDAAKRVDCSPWLWAIVAALAPCFIGVIVYLIIRKDYPLMGAGGERYAYQTYQQAGPKDEQYSCQRESETDGDEVRYNNTYESGAYEQPMPEKKGLPTWGKALIIIGTVVIAICLIALVVWVVQMIIGYNSYYDPFDALGSGHHYF